MLKFVLLPQATTKRAGCSNYILSGMNIYRNSPSIELNQFLDERRGLIDPETRYEVNRGAIYIPRHLSVAEEPQRTALSAGIVTNSEDVDNREARKERCLSPRDLPVGISAMCDDPLEVTKR